MDLTWMKVVLLLGVLALICALVAFLSMRGAISVEATGTAVSTIVGTVIGWLGGWFTPSPRALPKPPEVTP